MAAHPRGPAGTTTPVGDSVLAGRLTREIEGEVLFDPFSRGRYSTDASHYQIEPIGGVVPKTADDISRVIEIAADGLRLLERAPGVSVDEIRAATEPELLTDGDVPEVAV